MAVRQKDDDELVTVKVKKADSVSDGNNGFVAEGDEIDVTQECADSLKAKGLA